MNRKTLSGIFLLLFQICLAWQVHASTFLDPGFSGETVAILPSFKAVGMTFAPDGRIFIWQKDGVVRIYKNGALLPTPFLNFSDHVNTSTDRGMLGLALDPNLATNGYVYLLYVYEGGSNTTDSGPKTARLTRVTADPSNPDVALAGETVLLGTISTPPCSNYPAGSDCIPDDSDTHTIGTLRFAPDGNLFVGNGDGGSPYITDPLALRSQALNQYSGKILRIKPDGTAPNDNPFYDGTNSIQSKVWAYGLRNPYRFNLDPVNGEPIIGDVGWDTWEEVDRGRGDNFGWPCYEGDLPQPLYMAAFTLCQNLPASDVTFPIYTYDHSLGGAAVIGGAYYTGNIYPAQYQGNFFMADYVRNTISRMVFDSNNNLVSVIPFANNLSSPVSVEMGLDGYLYFVCFSTGEIIRIRFNGPSAQASANPIYGYSPLVVNFSSAGSSDPQNLPLTFFWDFGDGNTSTQANPTHTYTSAAVITYTVKLTVTNSNNQSSSDLLSITVGSLPPTATITSPSNGTNFQVGDTITYAGSATDPDDGPLPGSALSWMILLHHNDHYHSFLGSTGSGGSFVVPDLGDGVYGFKFVLTATDSSGLLGFASVSTHTCLAMTLDPPTVPNGSVGVAYPQQTFTPTGGVTPYTFSVSSGALPGGLTLNSNTGVLSGTPTVGGDFNFSITATDADGCFITHNYSVHIFSGGCLFCDDFQDGVLATDWTYSSNVWTETGGALFATSNKRATAIATPVYAGCSICSVETTLTDVSGLKTQASVIGWYQNSTTYVELLEKAGHWTLKQFPGTAKAVKTKALLPINQGTSYDVILSYDGANFTVRVNGSVIITMPAVMSPNGTFGFAVKGGTASFGEIIVN